MNATAPGTQSIEQWIVGYCSRAAAGGHDAELLAAARQLATTATVDQALVDQALRALERLSPDIDTVTATLLLPLEGTSEDGLSTEAVRPEVRKLLNQLSALTHFGRTYLPDDASRAEGLRRLLLALIDDVRVVLIALAWQLARLRLAAGLDDETRRRLAHETQLIHAPLANRLGIWQLKWELEDLAFLYLEPRTYENIRRLVAERRSDREAFISAFMARLREVVGEAGIDAEITGRAKHIYSIWRKMQRKGLDFHELFDVRAVRVLVDSLAECYTVLGLVHTHWQPVPGEFDDYITNPKANLYQSLHTAVTGSKGRVVEVQIRTHDMHRHAELGVAAHWRYKEGGPRDAGLEKRIGVMRKLIEGIDTRDDDDSLLESFQNVTSEDRVYVLTPRGEVKDLAAGATPLDFAYLVHTEVGHRCRGARVNGRIVPLTTALKNGDRVEILTAKEPRPSRDWLSPRLGYIRTARARSKVRHWFKQANFEDNLAAGRQAVENEFKRLELDLADLERILGVYNFRRVEDMLVAVGSGDLTAGQLAGAVERLHAQANPPSTLAMHKPSPASGERDDVRIEGVGNLLYQLARCCQPVPGDAIGGYITRGRGISIHRQDCRQFIHLGNQHPERIMDVRWAERAASRYPARILIEAWDRRELIRDIGQLLASEGINVSAMNAGHSDRDEQVRIELTVQVTDFEQLAGLVSRMQGISSVISVRRRK
ncbi:MAG: bifunctional (p)ppGpp synthetase/guanosine-3',5'-bis(diphosphate) 3'-pyrophosphohydrolase [Wenzhouxiangella sp.]|nr:bifunctional (p)ppGpp synthetase/guanosine-3',5'-bis(diphosphate) 3'-pyrophosphohydrolase [Wenzhouxiangella sp.]TVR98492.1 MAG: bifunctional (p)ppGpp synthetase/guanosine-3',5'-bis(diphosphate) 3'-pyrophosphohydrolase [Wenzhouxiangellaceae bacterium]